jgi:hypothetical protein
MFLLLVAKLSIPSSEVHRGSGRRGASLVVADAGKYTTAD